MFFWLRTLGLTLAAFKSKGGICLLASVIADNEPSVDSIRRNSFEQIDVVPKWLNDISESWIQGRPVQHFCLPTQGVLEHAKKFVDAMKNPSILHRVENTNGKTRHIEIELEIEWFNKAFSVITQIVRGDIPLGSCGFSSVPRIIKNDPAK
jgi:hypothetical protein